MEDAVKRYKIRRSRRMKKRMDAQDEGEWKTTSTGHRILVKDGAVAGGSIFTMAVMGAPDKAMPKGKVELKKSCPYDGVKKENMPDLKKAFEGRRQKNCIFGGFYKVEENESEKRTSATFFNPYTGEYFEAVVKGERENDLAEELRGIGINKEASEVWKKSNS